MIFQDGHTVGLNQEEVIASINLHLLEIFTEVEFKECGTVSRCTEQLSRYPHMESFYSW